MMSKLTFLEEEDEDDFFCDILYFYSRIIIFI